MARSEASCSASFFVPIFSAAVGAGIGALQTVRSATSASTTSSSTSGSKGCGHRGHIRPVPDVLERRVADRISQRFIGMKPELIATSLAPSQEAETAQAFGQE